MPFWLTRWRGRGGKRAVKPNNSVRLEIKVTVQIFDESNPHATMQWDLSDAQVLTLLPLLLKLPSPTPAAVELKQLKRPAHFSTIDWALEVLRDLGEKATIREITALMLSRGWESTSKTPEWVVRSVLFQNGWTRPRGVWRQGSKWVCPSRAYRSAITPPGEAGEKGTG